MASDRKLGSSQAGDDAEGDEYQADQGLVADEDALQHGSTSSCQPRRQALLVTADSRDLIGRAARLHDQDAVADGDELGNVVGDHDHAHAFGR